jgi:hypothetical protein
MALWLRPTETPSASPIRTGSNRHVAFGWAHFCFGVPPGSDDSHVAQLVPRAWPLVCRTNLGLRGLTSLLISFPSASAGDDAASLSEKRIIIP